MSPTWLDSSLALGRSQDSGRVGQGHDKARRHRRGARRAPRPICYVLENDSQTDLAVLNNACAELAHPEPGALLALVRQTLFPRWRGRLRAPRYLVQLVDAAALDPEFDIDLVPVAIYLGRAPQKEESVWRLLFTEDWVLVGRFRKLLNVLLNGRNTVVYFGEPIGLRDAIGGLPPPRSVRRLLRSLRAEFRAQRASTIGPDLSHRRTMVAHILRTQAVRHAVRSEMGARRAGAEHARTGAGSRARARAAAGGAAHGAQVRNGDRGELLAALRHFHGRRCSAVCGLAVRRC